MKTKDKTVNMALTDNMKNALVKIETACQRVEGPKYEMTITSAKDGKHMVGSLHYTGNAIDIRTRDMIFLSKVKRQITFDLGIDFDVVLENDHIHIEYDPQIITPKKR
jgi:hypothetical protein